MLGATPDNSAELCLDRVEVFAPGGEEPVGAFYVFVNVRRFTDDVHAFAFQILEQAGVAVTPGVDFGPGGEGYIRISYANSLENIEEGMIRLRAFLEEQT